jgi:hypothetical protein
LERGEEGIKGIREGERQGRGEEKKHARRIG